MKLKRHLNLLALPVLPPDHDRCMAEDIIDNTYLEEKKRITSGPELRRFVRRWRNLWLLRPGGLLGRNPGTIASISPKLLKEEVGLLEGRYNAKRVVHYLSNPDEMEHKLHLWDVRVAAQVMIPGPLLHSFRLANKYGVGRDLAMIRIYLDTYGIRLERGKGVYYGDWRKKMSKLTAEQIEKLSKRKGVKAIAVTNFLGSLGDMSSSDAWNNLRADAKSYKWNAATQKAISDGIILAFKK